MALTLINRSENPPLTLIPTPSQIVNNITNTSLRTNVIGTLIIGGGILALYFIQRHKSSNILPKQRLPENLEHHLSSQVLCLPEEKPQMPDYRRPNEGSPEYIKHHLKFEAPGICITTGSERAMTTLISCVQANQDHPEFFQGVVCIDINPIIKCYNDFNVLLLRLSKNQKEYQELSGVQKWARSIDSQLLNQKPDLHACRAKVRKKLENDTQMPGSLRKYYLKNFDRLADGFYGAFDLKGETGGAFFNVNYPLSCKKEFEILQQNAKAGKMITVVGDINDLSFLQEFQINAIDISNIYAFTPIQFQFPKRQIAAPRVIWSEPGWMATLFRSAIFPIGQQLNIEPLRSLAEKNPSYIESVDKNRWLCFGPNRTKSPPKKTDP